MVKLEVNPYDAFTGQILDFIELDGTVSLSLDAVYATVDTANDTLTWTVASQPWEDGDQLISCGPGRLHPSVLGLRVAAAGRYLQDSLGARIMRCVRYNRGAMS